MTWTLLALSMAAPPEPPPATPAAAVTGVLTTKKVTFDGCYATLWEGLALTLVGSSAAVGDLKAEDWNAAKKKKHILVSYPKPHGIKGPGAEGGKTYAVNEILVRVADTGVIKGLWVRCGATYYAFDKYNTALALFIEERHLPPPK